MLKRTTSIVAAALVAATVLVPSRATAASDPDRMPAPYEIKGGHLLYATPDGGRGCRFATIEELDAVRDRSLAGDDLVILQPEKLARARRGETTGLTIILRASSQLNSFPAARDAYIRAAETLEALIRTQITVIIDVDYGPTLFGDRYPTNVVGLTDPQYGDFVYFWSFVRPRLIQRSDSDAEAAILNLLPPTTGVPTTAGLGTNIAMPTANQRALGILDPVPDEEGELDDYGPPPVVGLNSDFLYDFDPTDGIAANRLDFTGTVLHEFGHVLGLFSFAGFVEQGSGFPIYLTTWDLYRFRPGVTTGTFTSSPRVANSGGEHIFFAGGSTGRLATGRPNGMGGDGTQSGHWKDNALNGGVYVGIMDAAVASGDQDQVTALDLQSLDFMGYSVKGLVNADEVTAVLTGNTLTLSGVASVANFVLAEANVKILDGSGAMLSDLGTTEINAVGNAVVELELPDVDLTALRTATAVEVTLFDQRGNASAPLRADFGAAVPGGPSVATLTYNGKKMKVTGTGFAAPLQLEINGVVVSATVKVKGGGTKLNIKGTPAALGLESGPNRVRFIGNTGTSNIFILNR